MPLRPVLPLAAIVLANLSGRVAAFLHRLPSTAGCTELLNRGTHFSVEVDVGTPPQKFDVVADTGSNTLIVPSCICQQRGNCNKKDSCFVGTNRSSTFSITQGPKGPQGLYLTFGSGTIAGVVVQDMVRVGQLSTYMKDGLLLMTDQALDFGGPFEGILGLGLPTQEAPERQHNSSSEHGHEAHRLRRSVREDEEEHAQSVEDEPVVLGQEMQKRPPGFLEEANIGRFSMCFNYNSDGVLRLGTSTKANAHGSIGTFHWGVGFRGVSVGSSSADVSACKAHGNRSVPCGAIPDSGTTLIMGPRQHVLDLFQDLCDRWPRCARNHTAMKHAAQAARKAAAKAYGFNPFVIQAASKAAVLQHLLLDCHSWMNETDGDLEEMPPLFFHVAGSNGTQQTLTLPPRAYVIEQELQHTGHAASLLDVDRSTGGKVCSPAFGVMDYFTQTNGPVWILGTPIFYEFTVGYDMSSKPPTISFSPADSEPCVTCTKTAGLVTASSRGKPRFLPGPARLPTSIKRGAPF